MSGFFRWFLAGMWILQAFSGAEAQSFPDKPVTMVIPFSPGGSNDVIGRYLAAELAKHWKQPVIVENKPGAGAVIGTSQVARSKPDGLTLLFISASYTTNAASLKTLPYDPVKDLVPVGLGAVGQFIIVTGSRVQLPDLAEVAKQAKAQTIFYGTAGLGNSGHFATELFAEVAGIKMEPVHYKGGTEAMTDLSGGRIDLYLGTVTQVLPSVQSKKATPIAVLSKERSAVYPDVPTVAQAGIPGAEVEFWWGVFAPSATPPEIVGKTNEDINAVMNTPDAAEFLAKQGASPKRMSPAEFSGLVTSEMAKWKSIAAKHNIIVQ